ncbi:SIMPL domain-containing protein [Marinobacter daqiaonensis]|nr:SIMPL domain-containing protein [Marinobacter daqiaonensis]
MFRHKAMGLVVAALALLPTVSVAAEVTLTGESRVQYVPDSARLEFTITAENASATRAAEEVHSTMEQWREGIAGYRDQLVNYRDADAHLYRRQMSPGPRQNDSNSQEETVAVASQTITFEIDDLELLNPLLEQAQSLGMNYHLGSHQFFHSKQAQLEQQALAGAIRSARSRCEFAARQLDMQCGKVKTLDLQGGYRPEPMMMAESARSDSNTVSDIGRREITASVSATFSMK